MLNETLNKVQSNEVEILAPRALVIDTGIANEASANFGVAEQAKQRLQRMRRRHQRARSLGNIASGWVARMA